MNPGLDPLALLYTMLPLWLLALVAGAAVPWALLRERRLAPVDVPGQHRSHAAPTPRGGGLGIALALFGGLVGIWQGAELPAAAHEAAWLALAVFAVAAIGAIDDHRGLSPWPRLAVHLLAAIAVCIALQAAGAPWWWQAIALVAIAWSINLHNFMDGSNGLLALQAMFVAGFVTVVALDAGAAPLATFAGATTFACLGFLPFNFPRAKIFLGDVGSGVLGLAVGIIVLRAVAGDVLSLPAAATLVSAFVVDATLTLLSRMARGRRWYTRHREHLYQWLVRGGASHARVAMTYLFWNIWVALPTTLLIGLVAPAWRWPIALVVYATAIVVWFAGKRIVLQARGRRRRTAVGSGHEARHGQAGA